MAEAYWNRSRKRDIGIMVVGLVVGLPLVFFLHTVGVLIVLALAWVFLLTVGRRWEEERPPEERARMRGENLTKRQRRLIQIGTVALIALITVVVEVVKRR